MNSAIQQLRQRNFVSEMLPSSLIRFLGGSINRSKPSPQTSEDKAGSPDMKFLLPSPHCSYDIAQARFSLPSTEDVLGIYICALQKRNGSLRHGRLYIFHNYVAFASDLPGFSYSMLLKLVDVSRIKKAKTLLVVPNAIRFYMVEGTSHCFTSFMSRNEAYYQILDLWLIAKEKDAANTEISQAEDTALCSTRSCSAITADCCSMKKYRSRPSHNPEPAQNEQPLTNEPHGVKPDSPPLEKEGAQHCHCTAHSRTRSFEFQPRFTPAS
uniref:GRAM domain-containing protein n=1 Tax=Cryptomonas curvata TaxID=233186 RepID=A0A7S0LV29_9CRYP|mmetsp:Transcript_11938/g.25637  ORF Transcript_11938/g.25637 Transcript_11938/m.25637 type:complete len:268 (+) Transcript_11938:121-924(+)